MLYILMFLIPFVVISANMFPSGYNLVNHTICITKITDLTLEDERLLLSNLKCPPRTYFIGKQRVSWFEAYVLCLQYGMELASVESVEEEMTIEELLKLEADGSKLIF
ncbi:unnamed protein product [Ceutorhynchus assimilis]|uniref:C-type lectin domain-containing protein n=1 Tax=Ceutorhynchus assimilis TaxID=467358 RepID=A0A9N9QRL3_9CUCU|nr:unnamed protein product [Ceutorhynchus assimilis]CAG9772221.1 unnamed protein product [Ceutorhynchus assimilis]